MWLFWRKFWLSVVALMFRATPQFQLSLALAVMFSAYVLQVQHRPYLSSAEKLNVIANHLSKINKDEDAIDESSVSYVNRILAQQLEVALNANKRTNQKNARRNISFARQPSRWAKMTMGKSTADRFQKQRNYLFDYNTIEMIYLACAIVICLCGIMLDSDHFRGANAAMYEYQRDIITVVVCCVLFGSFLYYIIVFCSEVLGFTPDWLIKLCAKSSLRRFASVNDVYNQTGDKPSQRDSTVALNPMITNKIQGENNGGKKNSNDEVLSKSMLKEKRKKAKETLIAKSMKPSKKAKKMKGIKGKRGKKKIYFEKKKNDQMDPNIAGEGPAVGMIEMSEMKSDTENPMRKKTNSFRRLETSVGGREYFENLGKPGQTTWKVPEGGEIVLSD